MVPDVFFTVCHGQKNLPPAVAKLYTFQPALLHGYCRRRVKFADYPGITEEQGHSVFGTFATGLTRANIQRLDQFEGGQYERRLVSVKLLDKVGNVKGEGNVEGEEKKAWVYVFLAQDELEDREWDLEEFRKEKMKYWTRDGLVFDGKSISTFADLGEAQTGSLTKFPRVRSR